MSPRSGGMDWNAARQATRAAAVRAADPGRTVYVRRGERSDQWLLRPMRYAGTCEVCEDEIIKGERCWMQRTDAWHFQHEACRE